MLFVQLPALMPCRSTRRSLWWRTSATCGRCTSCRWVKVAFTFADSKGITYGEPGGDSGVVQRLAATANCNSVSPVWVHRPTEAAPCLRCSTPCVSLGLLQGFRPSFPLCVCLRAGGAEGTGAAGSPHGTWRRGATLTQQHTVLVHPAAKVMRRHAVWTGGWS